MRRTLLVVAALAAGCSADGGAPGNDGGGGGDGALLSDLSSSSTDLAGLPSVYPAGPYGNTVGMTMAPLLWEGYRDDLGDAVATSKPYGAYSMDDLRQSGRSYAIVHVAEFY